MELKSPDGNISRIKEELERRLVVMRYSKVTAKTYLRIFSWVEDFLGGYGEVSYSKEAGQRFIAEYSLQSNHSPAQFKNALTVIRRLDEILENKLFAPCFRKAELKCPPRFTDQFNKYIEHLVKRGLRGSTITTRKRYAGQLLGRFPDKIPSLDVLSAADLYSVFTQYEWPVVAYSTAKSLFVFLFETGVTNADLSVCVPKPIRPRPLPSVYTGDEVAQLLASVDRSTCSGKRDYAILMLAAHLGLRSSDIVNLSFTDINYTMKTIGIIQVKTGYPLTLVMNANVEEAVADYIQNGRPHSSGDKIFIGSHVPYTPISAGAVYAVVRKYFDYAGVIAQGRRRGPHTLRTSYATALVAKGVPYAVVQEALGHDDPESTKYYVRVDVRRLKTCALDIPPPAGAFAVLLGDLEGVL
jgi:site-specific recombinase XerD